MDMELNRLEIFKNELALIKNPQIKEFCIKALYLLPTYFFEVPASSTGKYHPSYSLGLGGLVRHTQGMIKIAVGLFDNNMFPFTDDEKDIIITACMLHDGMKHGVVKQTYSIFNHPMVVADEIEKNVAIMSTVSKEIADKILNAIRSHMGQWSTNPKSSVVLPTPQTPIEKFVHLVDYLGSRRFLEVKFD